MQKFFTLIAFAFCFNANAQVNWTFSNSIAANTFSNMHPRMTMDAQGNPLVIWGRMSDQSTFFSRWNGTMFTTPVKLNGTLTVASATWMGADIASHGDTVYVVMKQTPEADSTKHIYIVRSFDGGQNFSVPVRVDFIGDSISRFPTVTCDATGNPIVAFMKFNSSFVDSRWVVTKSTDYGTTFSVDTKASGWGASAEVCDCCPGAVVSSASNCMMLYRNNNSNIRDTWTGFSTNNGSSFTNGCNVDGNNWMIMSCPSTGPDGIVIGDTLYSVFSSSGSGSYRNYLSKTSVSNATWNATQNLTGAIAGLTQQNYPRIASYGNAVGIVWKQNVSGIAQLPMLFTNDIANGFPASYDIVDLTDITNTDIAMGNGKVAVCWEDDNSGTVKIRIGTFSPSTTGISETILKNSFTVYPNPFSSKVTLQTDNIIYNATITVNNINGQVVKEIRNFSGQTVVLSRDNLPNGLYFVRVTEENKIITVTKLVITD